MDLRNGAPRSARARFAGVVMAPRTTDKCRASLAGTLGAYIYNCPLDRELFEFLGTTADEFAAAVQRAGDDAAVEAFVAARVADKSPAEVEAFNREFLRYEVDLSRPSYRDMAEALARRAPGRTDLTLWVDLTDIEEEREVPSPEAVRAFRASLGLPPAGDTAKAAP